LLLAILAGALLSWLCLGLSLEDLVPREGGRSILTLFIEGALNPALDYEAASVPEGTPPLLAKVADAALNTLLFAIAGMSLALVFGLVLGFLGSSSWWATDGAHSPLGRGPLRRLMPFLYASVRALIALMRSVHELLWAILFLAAFGLNNFSAVIAIAIPYGGTLAKVFSELLDECPRESARNLRAIGAGPIQVFLWGFLPRAIGDMSAYSFYRFECAVRSSAILGFFGYPTLGYFLRLSAENLHYREVWTYLYALIMIVLVLELWSARLRVRMVIR
jgi:phosphonate transport system permease protein